MAENESFTLMELIIVIVIVGILAILALTQYGSYKENTLDREAQANLRLVIAAQRIYRMEVGGYYPLAGGSVNNIANINTNLRLLLSTAANRSWNYLTTSNVLPAASCAQSTRNGGDSRTFRIRNSEDNPVAGAVCP